MRKSYELLNNTEPMSAEEIKGRYSGRWVYVVNAKLTDTGKLLSGIPVITGSKTYDGAEDGIYEKYNGDEYVERVCVNMLPNRGFISSLRFVNEGVNV